jgi:uncharacterized protein with PIN domain
LSDLQEEQESAKQEGSFSLSFLVDGMLGSLATKLRILGFDTLYDKQSDDRNLITRALNKGLVLVTSDQELYRLARQRHAKAVLVKGATEQERLIEVFQKVGVRSLDLWKMSRCSACNSPLQDTGKKDDLGREIFKCKACGKSFWRGSHWKKLDTLFSNVNSALIAANKILPNAGANRQAKRRNHA